MAIEQLLIFCGWWGITVQYKMPVSSVHSCLKTNDKLRDREGGRWQGMKEKPLTWFFNFHSWAPPISWHFFISGKWSVASKHKSCARTSSLRLVWWKIWRSHSEQSARTSLEPFLDGCSSDSIQKLVPVKRICEKIKKCFKAENRRNRDQETNIKVG